MEAAAAVHGEPLQDGNCPPNVESAVEILQDKVTKQIIKEGHGRKPSKYATCFCKFSQLCLFYSFQLAHCRFYLPPLEFMNLDM